MGLIHDMMNDRGLYTESDMKELKYRCHTLWKELVSIKCSVEVYANTIKEAEDKRMNGIGDEEILHSDINQSCLSLLSKAMVAEHVIGNYSRFDLGN